jgi:beta-xylosidase
MAGNKSFALRAASRFDSSDEKEISQLTHMSSSLTPLLRADELLCTMTIEEKAFQLSSIWSLALFGPEGLIESQLEELLGMGIGHIAILPSIGYKMPSAVAGYVNRIQRFLVERTRLGIPTIFHCEALNGVLAPQFTSFPTAIGLAATWNPEGVRQMADLIRRQMLAIGQRQALSPVMDVARDARWGRVHETYGEDPYLCSAMSVAFVRGLQGNDLREGVLATGKHFLGYALTEGGMNQTATQMGMRELYEVYARPFEAAIHLAGLGSVMNSYSEYDGVPVGGSHAILTELLRERMGFTGTVVSDYGTIQRLVDPQMVAADAHEAGVLALTAGLDVELPSVFGYGSVLAESVRQGLVSEQVLDEAVRRILRDKFALGLFDNPYLPEDPIVIDTLAHEGGELAGALARQSITLLQNKGDLLPLSRNLKRIAIVGPHANSVGVAFADYTYPATLAAIRNMMMGQAEDVMVGLGAENFPPSATEAIARELTPVLAQDPDTWLRSEYGAESLADAVRRLVPQAEVTVVAGTGLLDEQPSDIPAAVEVARAADVVILALGGRSGAFQKGITEGEGADTGDIELPNCQVELVKAVAETGVPAVGVVYTGRPMAVTEIVDDLLALLWGSYGGQAAGAAMADVIFGEATPGGKLPYSIPRHSGQVPVYYAAKNGSGYRRTPGGADSGYLDMPSTPLFAFGRGLSYTSFAYADLTLGAEQVPIDGSVTISVRVTNTGERAGDEVVQLYFHDRATGVTRPYQELVGFKRVHLEPSASTVVEFEVQMSQLGYVGITGGFILEPGPIEVWIGSASDDIRARGRFQVVGDTIDLHGRRSYLSTAVERV